MPASNDSPVLSKVDQTEATAARSGLEETAAVLSGSAAAAPAFAPAAERGEVGTLGPYRIIKQLGHGGMGAVYAALDTRLNRKVALKVMLPQFAADAAAKQRFLREARAAAQVTHDNVVTVYEADERGGVTYIAMQFLEGYSLDAYLKKKGDLSVAQILRIARETAAGLAAAHRIGLVHRDIKPANLWLEAPHGRVKVLDFGLAKPMDTDVELTKSGAIVGTPAYMSPEQARGDRIDHRTDLFSLGAVLYRLCAGRLPFQGQTSMAILMALGTLDPPPVRELNPALPPPLAELIHQLLAKTPTGRPATADAVVKRLVALAETVVPVARVTGAAGASAVAAHLQVSAARQASPFANLDVTEHEVVRQKEPPKAASAWRWLLAGIAAFLLVVVSGIIIIIRNRDGSETEIKVPDGARVTIKGKDGKTLAEVGPEKKKPVADVVSQRDAARWVLKLGGRVWINGERGDVTVADIDSESVVTHVFPEKCKGVTDAGLACLRGCKDLQYLNLTETGVTDAGLAHASQLHELANISCQTTAVTDKGLAHLNGLKKVRVLTLKELNHLFVGGTKVTDAGLGHLSGCTNLTHLDMGGTDVSNVGLAHLKGLRKLESFGAAGTKITDDGLAHIGQNTKLTRLSLVGTAITDKGLAHVKDCKDLMQLRLSTTTVSDKGLAYFKDCKNLTLLDVRRTKVTAKALAEFHAAVPACKIEHDGGVIESKK